MSSDGLLTVNADSSLPGISFDESKFRQILGKFATGVTVVTMLNDEGQLSGLTANSFNSLSLDPPLILVCVSYQARSYKHLRNRQEFAVHILDADQAPVARRFAVSGGEKSAACDWHVNERGFPILSRFHAVMECRLHQEYEGGDHAIIVGRVQRLYGHADAGDPLLFYQGQFFPLVRDGDN